MNLSHIRFYVLLVLLIFLSNCTQTEKLIIKHQVTGGISANCYLVYSEQSKEAVLIDVGGTIDTLMSFMESKNLKLKYLLCTHGHFDHIIGIPEVKRKFPHAKIVMHQLDYNDIPSQKEWAEQNFGPEFMEWLKSDPERKKIHDFDYKSLGQPDIFIEDNQALHLGNFEIRVIHSPGHSPGSICYRIENSLFSGDVLFYRTVGRTDLQNSSRKDQIESVRRLYVLIPDETIVYPGHGQFTDIGSEKVENTRITINGGAWSTGLDTLHTDSDKL